MNEVSGQRGTKTPILEIRGLKKHFPLPSAFGRRSESVKAVDGVNFSLFPSSTLGLVGESGCGKSTTGRLMLRLIEPTAGQALFKGDDIFQYDRRQLQGIRKSVQMIFQDPHTAFDPKMRIGKSVIEPMVIHNIGTSKERVDRAFELLHKVGIRQDQFHKFPHEFSGGQRQRIAIARALAVNPEIIICDEPVSSLDVSIQSQVINLLRSIQDEFDVSFLFISHDLSVVRHVADEVGVMYLGHLVEKASSEELFGQPLHPYTRALISSVPQIDNTRKREQIVISGEVPSPINPPSGCVFHTRCPMVMEVCKSVVPKLTVHSSGHEVSCHLYS